MHYSFKAHRAITANQPVILSGLQTHGEKLGCESASVRLRKTTGNKSAMNDPWFKIECRCGNLISTDCAEFLVLHADRWNLISLSKHKCMSSGRES